MQSIRLRFDIPQSLLCVQVEGKLSIACYLTALDRCYARLCQKAERMQARRRSEPKGGFSLADVDFCVMHVS